MFKKKSVLEKKKIADELDSLLEVESLWKDLIKSSKYDASKIKSIFPEEMKHFVRIFNKSFYPPEDTTNRKKKMYYK